MKFIKKSLSIMLIIITMGLFFNNSVNWHYHKLPDGRIVEHAHPFSRTTSSSGSPFENHRHSDFEYLILDLVYYSGLIILIVFNGLIVFLRPENLVELTEALSFRNEPIFTLPLLRAPPAF